MDRRSNERNIDRWRDKLESYTNNYTTGKTNWNICRKLICTMPPWPQWQHFKRHFKLFFLNTQFLKQLWNTSKNCIVIVCCMIYLCLSDGAYLPVIWPSYIIMKTFYSSFSQIKSKIMFLLLTIYCC